MGGLLTRRDTDLKHCRRQIIKSYKDTTSTIPIHPLYHSRTVDIDEFFFDLVLTKELQGTQRSHEHVRLCYEEKTLDKPLTVPIKRWEDLFNPDFMGKSKIIISGGAGFGKTTLLMKVANASTVSGRGYPTAKFKLVFLVKLKEMQKTSCVIDAILEQLFPRDTNLKTKLHRLIVKYEADIAFILDGLDEIPSDVLESTAGVYRVKDILHNRVLVNSFVLVTTRPHMINYVISGYPNYALVQTLGFTSETINKYIQSYFAHNAISIESLIDRIQSNQSLQSLARIPLITQFLCIIWENQPELPDKLTALFTQFVECFVKRRCRANEDDEMLMHTVMRDLGRIALDGSLDQRGERLTFKTKEYRIQGCGKALEDGCRLGFLQEETKTIGLEMVKVVTFLHKSFQEYFAAYHLANMTHSDKDNFPRKLEQITLDNVYGKEYLLRFVCGMSSEAAGSILEHIQKMQDDDEEGLQELARLLLFESGSKELVSKLDPPSRVEIKNREDLIALHYYIGCIPQSLLGIFLVVIAHACKTYKDLKLLGDILRSGNINSSQVVFIISKEKDYMQHLADTLKSIDKGLRDRLQLGLVIDEKSYCDAEDMSASLSRVSKLVWRLVVLLDGRSFLVIIKEKEMMDCRLYGFGLQNTNIHGHVTDLAHIVTPFLKELVLRRCGLVDDDVPNLISILHAGHGLETLCLDDNAFSLDAMNGLTDHVQGLPQLTTLSLDNIGLDEHVVKQLIWKTVSPITIRSREDLTLLKDAIVNGIIHCDQPILVRYILSGQGKEDMQHLVDTLAPIDKGLRGLLDLTLYIDAKSYCEAEDMTAFLPSVSKLVWRFIVLLNGRSCHDFIGKVKAMKDCRLYGFYVFGTNMHGHVTDLAPIVTPSLKVLHLGRCRLVDDDVPNLISILPTGHGLKALSLDGNAFSLDAMNGLTDHVQGLPKLDTFSLNNIGLDEHVVKQLIWITVSQISIRSREDLTLLKDAIVSGNIHFHQPKPVFYILSAEGKEDLQHLVDTLGLIDKGLRDRLQLTLYIDDKSYCEADDMCAFLPRVSKQVWRFDVVLDGRACHEVIDKVKAMKECRLYGFYVYDTNMHGHVTDLAPLVTPSLKVLVLGKCGLIDDDVPNLIGILPVGHGLKALSLDGNAFGLDAMNGLTDHLQGLPELATLSLDNIGLNEDIVKQVVGQHLPHLKETELGVFKNA